MRTKTDDRRIASNLNGLTLLGYQSIEGTPKGKRFQNDVENPAGFPRTMIYT